MKLTIKSRILIANLLPAKGDFVTLTIKQDLADKIKITQEEIVETQIEAVEGGLKWNVDKDIEKEFEITELEKELVAKELKELDSKKELTDDTIILYKLFI